MWLLRSTVFALLGGFSSFNTLNPKTFFFGGGRDSNPGPCIYYALSIPTELSSWGQIGSLDPKTTKAELPSGGKYVGRQKVNYRERVYMRENRDNWSCVTELGRDILFNFSAFNFGLMRLFLVEASTAPTFLWILVWFYCTIHSYTGAVCNHCTYRMVGCHLFCLVSVNMYI